MDGGITQVSWVLAWGPGFNSQYLEKKKKIHMPYEYGCKKY
jgi:hypothetical protein